MMLRPTRLALFLSFVLSPALTIAVLPTTASADTRMVNCDTGRRISTALRLPAGRPLTVNVRGTCTDNLVIDRDNVTIQKDPSAPATPVLNPLNSNQATILIDGARNVQIKDLTVNGGAPAVVGTKGAVFRVVGTAAVAPLSCVIQGGTRSGIVASYGAIATVDGCLIQNVGGDGVVVANTSSLTITNSTVQNNTGSGIIGARSSQLRVGQDADGTASTKPVTVSGHTTGNGIVITESSAGSVVGGSVTGSGKSAIFVGRGSSAQIGVGASNHLGPVTVGPNNSWGIFVEGASATILGNTIANNGDRGIGVFLGGNARIGLKNDSTGFVGNQITGNARGGVLVSSGSSAYLAGNLIDANKPATLPANAFIPGVEVYRSTATLVGDNTVSNHATSGVFVSGGGNARIGDTSFGALSAVNTITGNGNGGGLGNLAAVYAFEGASIEIRRAVIENNFGQGLTAFEGSVVDIRDGTVVRNTLAAPDQTRDLFDAGHGIVAGLRSTIRIRDSNVSITGNAGHGVFVQGGAGVDFRNTTTGVPNVIVTGNSGYGLRCFGSLNYSGNVLGITGNGDLTAANGNDDGTNPSVGNIQGCFRF